MKPTTFGRQIQEIIDGKLGERLRIKKKKNIEQLFSTTTYFLSVLFYFIPCFTDLKN